MEFDHSKLAGRIKEKFGSQSALAKHLGWAESKLSNRMNNKKAFETDEILALCRPDCLDIEALEIPKYFFTPKF